MTRSEGLVQNRRVTSREIVKSIIGRNPAPRCGFWLGNPHPDTWPRLHRYFGTKTEEELRRKLGDDFRWISPSFIEGTFPNLGRVGLFDLRRAGAKASHGQAGPLADCDRPEDLEAFDWPDPSGLDFRPAVEALDEGGPYYRASGFWSPFYHDLMDLFGMEHYFVKMIAQPDVVRAATDRVCGFYFEANARFYDAAGDRVDGFFFGNDFGTQLDLMISPRLFDAFVLPWMRRLTEQAHGRGYQVILHSCGSIARVIDRLVEAGVDCLHPLQAMAVGMEAEKLGREFGGRVAFLGGIDTQRVLNTGTPAQVRSEVRRVMDLLGPHLIVSPSHEALLPDVPPPNIAAMAEVVR